MVRWNKLLHFIDINALIHFADGTTQEWLMLHMEKMAEEQVNCVETFSF
jgi:hypothetical protein